MRADATPLLSLFENKIRFEVPLFQRQYVWEMESQWQPLWEDIERKFTDFLEGRKDAPVHFLGAMVMDQKMTPTTHVIKRQVIDGQQRLTTFQLFLAAFRDFCAANDCQNLAEECTSYIINRGMMADPETDKFKVWPTQLDRTQFIDVMTLGSREALETKYPRAKKKYTRIEIPRPKMVDAYCFFYAELSAFFLGNEQQELVAADYPLAARIDESLQALKSALQVVVIDLEHGDDAQVIFETLNARGEPLLPADLLRNYVFLRAARHQEPQEELYRKYWQQFDESFWRIEMVQGRLQRPRSDLFLQHYLASRLVRDIGAKHLFSEYKHWIEKGDEYKKIPFTTVVEEVTTLARQRDFFRRLLEPESTDVLYPIATFLRRFDSSTAYPLLLHLGESNLTNEEWQTVSQVLESYIVRRAICGWTSKNYNRTFLVLTKIFRDKGFSVERLRDYLAGLTGDSAEWPTDAAFADAWENNAAYWTISPKQRLVWVLLRLNDSLLTKKNETVVVQNNTLTIEHLMPQSWIANWPLADGQPGLTGEALENADATSSQAKATHQRTKLVQTMGNLTLITQPLNSAVSNGPWSEKRPDLLAFSLLPINQRLYDVAVWDEQAILTRSRALFKQALQLWPRLV